ncbi:hypothetical protein CRM22_003039 [Opisthorchis felineus]|uniref:Uncharacterized protein n=1 Tax=Opisthorchis felineus TaxID=147828 RepID=A0A4S2M370_OPIFE|nr:hypothetical protein CRM22_003039 [Opisthorchis felineus]
MSTERGNNRRCRPPKYQNAVAYKNNMHDTSKRTKEVNNLIMESLCARCKGILEWKVKYKKYRPLSQPTICLKCGQKTVKRAYYTVCAPCIDNLHVCGKCGNPEEVVIPRSSKTQEQINREFEKGLEGLRERERRTLLRIAENSSQAEHTAEHLS